MFLVQFHSIALNQLHNLITVTAKDLTILFHMAVHEFINLFVNVPDSVLTEGLRLVI